MVHRACGWLCRDKVVAVFAHGPAWQFKNWLWSSPVEIFNKSMLASTQ